jgi:hypothetical protein
MMKSSSRLKWVASLIGAVTFVASCGKTEILPFESTRSPSENVKSNLDTVDIPNTKVKDQRRVGFCWSYALAAMLESQYLLRTGQTINISEEALGFYRMLEQLHWFSTSYQGAQLDAQIDSATIDGYWAIYRENPYLDAFRLVKKYGLVPDSVWSHKFGGPNDVNGDEKIVSIKATFKKYMKGKGLGSVSRDQIITNVLLASKAYPSKPPSAFDWQGSRTTAQQFALNTLQFNPDDYDVVTGFSLDSFDDMVDGLKRSLASGKPALLSFDVYNNYINGGDLAAPNVDPFDPSFSASYSGRHMVLATDFVNLGGRPGGMTREQIRSEVQKPASELDYVVFKNSWGYQNWNSSSRRMIEPGMYTMDSSYIRGNLANGAWELVMPKQFVTNPKADFVVPDAVTGTDELGAKELARTRNFKVSATDLNCRKGPGVENEIVTVLYTGDAAFGLGFETDSLGQQWMRVLVGDRNSDTQTKCYLRALKNYINLFRVGSVSCPAGSEMFLIGRDGGRYCMTPDNRVRGPFTDSMIAQCIDLGGGEDACRNSATWSKSLALKTRGRGICPEGTWYDYDVDYCSDDVNVFGPFPEKLINRCIAFTNDSVVCNSGRWSRKVMFFLQRSEN